MSLLIRILILLDQGPTIMTPGEGDGNPLLYSCLENPMDRGACQTTVRGVANTEQLIHTYIL